MAQRSLTTDLWNDTWFESLNPQEKLLFLYLLTNDRTNMLGIYEISKRKISFETGLTESAVEKGFESFERVSKIYYTDENYVVIKNFLKHQRFNTNMKKSALAIYDDLPKSLQIKDLDKSDLSVDEGFLMIAEGFGIFNLNRSIIEFKKKDKSNRVEEKGTEPFDDFWTHYPKQVSKEPAIKAWKKIPDEERLEAIRVVQIYPHSKDPQYIPYPATWLNAKSWEDDFDALKPGGSHPGSDRGLVVGQIVQSEGTQIPDEESYGL